MGQSYQGDISIDDVSMSQFCRLYTGPTPTAPPPTTGAPTSPLCPGFRFKCASGPCIDPKYVCDYRDDCGDGSDEVNCGMLTSVSLNTLSSFLFTKTAVTKMDTRKSGGIHCKLGSFSGGNN